MPTIANGLVLAFLLAFAALTVGSGVRVAALRNQSETRARKLRDSLVVWWLLTAIFAAALIAGKAGLAVLFCVAGLFALREFHVIFARRSFDSPILALSVAALGIGHYCMLVFTDSLWSMWGLPWIVLGTLGLIEILLGRTQDYLRSTAGYTWAFVLLIIGLSHVVALTSLPINTSRFSTGVVGWSLYLVLLTEVNDISQALVGRQIGRHKISPAISPGKTWEGLAGGMLITVLLASLLAPLLTTLTIDKSTSQALLLSGTSGVLISLGGFLGDLNMSGLKREAGVKDSSHMLPGMGGIIDRVDSLTITAPAFFYFASFVTKEMAGEAF